ITQIQEAERHGCLIPVAPRREELVRGRVLLVGDAAGVVDPITAEGISYAILSGSLAAAAISDAKLDVAQVNRLYSNLIRDQILGELNAGRFFANFLYNYPRARNWVFRRRGQELTDFLADVVMGQGTYSSAMKAPSSYLKLLGIGGKLTAEHC